MTTILTYVPPKGSPLATQDTVSFSKITAPGDEPPTVDFSKPTLNPAPKCPSWCVDCWSGEIMDNAAVFHHGVDRTIQAPTGLYEVVNGKRVDDLVDIQVTTESFVSLDPNENPIYREPPRVHLSINHSDGQNLTPRQARKLAANLCRSADELDGVRWWQRLMRVFRRAQAEDLQWSAGYAAGIVDGQDKAQQDRDKGYAEGYLAAIEVYQRAGVRMPINTSKRTTR